MAKQKQSVEKKTKSTADFPPVVAVLGHVDHGKTTLLDAIRKTSLAAREHGGITQAIGASSVEIVHEGKKRKLTFIDTPGHQAFSKMRSRGVQAADIGLLIVSSTDGVMPQTKESIAILQEAKTPFIVVFTKVDLPDRQTQKIKQQLVKEGIMLEGLGGDIPVMEVSAKTELNIKELLDLILLVWDMHADVWKNRLSTNPLMGVIIESRLDSKSGPRATMVIKDGKIGIKDELMAAEQPAKVKNIVTDAGKFVQAATIGEAVEILGFEKVPEVGSVITVRGSSFAKSDLVPEDLRPSSEDLRPASPPPPLTPHFVQSTQEHILSVIICADTRGSLEAIAHSLPKEIHVVMQKTGAVSENDVLTAKATGSIVLGFNTKIRPEVIKLAQVEKVLVKNYAIIYELLDEIGDVLEGKQIQPEEKIFGTAKVLASFPFEKTKVLGIRVLEGRVAKGDKVRLIRGEELVGESNISSVRQGKEIVSKAEKGQEAGITISPFLDFTIGDVLICHG